MRTADHALGARPSEQLRTATLQQRRVHHRIVFISDAWWNLVRRQQQVLLLLSTQTVLAQAQALAWRMLKQKQTRTPRPRRQQQPIIPAPEPKACQPPPNAGHPQSATSSGRRKGAVPATRAVFPTRHRHTVWQAQRTQT